MSRLFLVAVLVAAAPLEAREEGELGLYFMLRSVGEERYVIDSDGDSRLLTADFDYTERGFHNVLSTSLRLGADGTPLRFESKVPIVAGTDKALPGGAFTVR